MTKLLFLVLLFFSYGTHAAKNYVYAGLDIVNARGSDEFDTRDALLLYGMHVGVTRSSGVIFEVGLGEPNQAEAVSLRSALMYRLGFRLFAHVSPFVSAGGSWTLLTRQLCGYVPLPGTEIPVYQYTCGSEDFTSSGPVVEAGVNVEMPNGEYLTFKAARHRGNDQTRLSIFSIALSF